MFDPMAMEVDSATTCADALSASVREQRRVAARRMALVARWADTHAPESIVSGARRWRTVVDGDPDAPGEPDQSGATRTRPRFRGSGRVVQVGAEGTPQVTEGSIVELGVLLETTTTSAQVLLRDVLDLRHRLPGIWEAVMTGQVEDWKARKAAVATRTLTYEQARIIDSEILEALTGLPFLRAMDVVEGRVIAADPAAYEARRREEAAKRYVSILRRATPAGLRGIVAQTTARDVARLDAMIECLAAVLAQHGDTDSHQVRRAKALGILADPARACLLLAGAKDEPEPQPEPETAVHRARAVGEALLSLGAKALEKLRPRSILYVHLSDEALHGAAGTQVARTDLGPVSLAQLEEWLGADRVVVKPVIDLVDQSSVDAYEIPKRMAEHLRLREPYEVFPWGTLPSDKADGDHTRPYVPMDEGGPPGQTATDNLGPLGRRHHNAKTFGDFTCYQPLPGLYLWRLPCGLWYRVDHTGSHCLGRETPEILLQTRDRSVSRLELAWSDILVAA